MKQGKNNRIFELDFLRGLALILMCLDHLAYDLYCLPFWFPLLSDHPIIETLGKFGDSVAFSDWRLGLHYLFATLFLTLAGIGSALTRKPFRRSLLITGAALGLTVATIGIDLFFDAGVSIVFGVLSAMAVGALVCALCSLFGEKAGKFVALGAGIVIIVLGFSIPWYQAPVRYDFYPDELWGICLGTVRYGADWFPVFPASGVLPVGYFVGKILYRNKQSLIPALRGKDSFICKIGRKSLWIYLFHQPVLVGLLYLFVFLFVRT